MTVTGWGVGPTYRSFVVSSHRWFLRGEDTAYDIAIREHADRRDGFTPLSHDKPWFVFRNDGPKKTTTKKGEMLELKKKPSWIFCWPKNFETHTGSFWIFLLVRIALLARDSTVPSKKKLTTTAWKDLMLVFDEQGKYLKDFASLTVAWVAYSYNKLGALIQLPKVNLMKSHWPTFMVLIKSMQSR